MNIWIIGRNYPQLSNGMQGSFELEQAKMLGRYGEKVAYLAGVLHPFKSITERKCKSWEEDGVSVHTYSAFFMPRIYPLYAVSIRNYIWRKFLRSVQEKTGKPDIIHVHYPVMLMLAEVLKEYHTNGTKVIVTEHWSKVLTKSLDKIERKQYEEYFDYIDACICVGRPLAHSIQELVGNHSVRISVIPNVVDREFVPADSNHTGYEFIAVGRLVKIKQFDRIISAFAENFREKEVKLTIVGGGEEYHRLKKLISRLRMERQIVLTGNLNRTQVAQRLANADCLICYSKFETFGVPIIEAWASGIPTITTTMAAVTNHFDNRLGVEVMPDDTEELRKAMMYMYVHSHEYDKSFLSVFAKERFSEETVIRQLLNVYQQSR